MSTTVIRLKRSAMSNPLPDGVKLGDRVSVEMFEQPVRDGEPGLVTYLTDEWVEFRWDAR
jgi:hypothetical protein